MSFDKNLVFDTLKSTGRSGHHLKIVVATSSGGNNDGFAVVGTRGSRVYGVNYDNSTEATDHRIVVEGMPRIAAGDSSGGAAITVGLPVVASSQGQAVTSTAANQHRLGFAREPLAAATTGLIAVQIAIGLTT